MDFHRRRRKSANTLRGCVVSHWTNTGHVGDANAFDHGRADSRERYWREIAHNARISPCGPPNCHSFVNR
jgi:hypothetical protein